MALDGAYTLDDLVRMTSNGKQKPARHSISSDELAALSRRHVAVGTGRTIARARPVKRRLLGIDPGTRFVGWGLIELHDHTLRLLDSGCIAPPSKFELKRRLCHIFSELEAVLIEARPDAAALEETFAGVNMKSVLAMGEGRGVALLCLARANLEVLELSPRSIKQAVTGNGASGKAQVAAMVAAHLGLKKAPEPEHVSDALAAAIALARRYAHS